MEKEKSICSDKHINVLAKELARATGITADQALKVLKVMHIDKLNENMVAHREAMSNVAIVNALNLSQDAAKVNLKVAQPKAITLANLRVGIKPMGHGGIMV